MYHASWEMTSFEDLERLHQRILKSGSRITGYSDRACNVMFLDPDGNELEVFWMLPRDEWETRGFGTRRLDLAGEMALRAN